MVKSSEDFVMLVYLYRKRKTKLEARTEGHNGQSSWSHTKPTRIRCYHYHLPTVLQKLRARYTSLRSYLATYSCFDIFVDNYYSTQSNVANITTIKAMSAAWTDQTVRTTKTACQIHNTNTTSYQVPLCLEASPKLICVEARRRRSMTNNSRSGISDSTATNTTL